MGDTPSSGIPGWLTLLLLAGGGYLAWKMLFEDPKQGAVTSLGSTQKRKPSRAAQVKVESRYEEDQEDDLRTAVSLIDHSTMKDLQKQVRAAGFKGAQVWGISGRGGDGFIVGYDGQEYRFAIEEVDP